MCVNRQDGAVAAAVMLVAMLGMVLLGLVLDGGFLAVQQARLDLAAGTGARAAARACWSGAARGIDAACAPAVAERYLQANLPGAHLERVAVVPPDRLIVQASILAPGPFGLLRGGAPIRLRAEAGAVAGRRP